MRIFISGNPGSGKTSLVIKLLDYLDSYTGFVTREVRESGRRIGFVIRDLVTGEEDWLARIGAPGPRIGRYGVFIGNLERIALPALARRAEWTVIDEVGKMEFCSDRVKDAIIQALQRDNVIAVLHRNFLGLAGNDRIFWLERGRFDEVEARIARLLQDQKL